MGHVSYKRGAVTSPVVVCDTITRKLSELITKQFHRHSLLYLATIYIYMLYKDGTKIN